MASFKKMNGYTDILENMEPGLYEQIPKAVFAAMVISRLSCGGDHLLTEEDAREVIDDLKAEWWALYNSGVVPQKPRYNQKERQ